ncbi:MAG: hypothetical protein LBK42_04850 [Propionibacteriaceae bacterium]|jgi:hypothetical protein|nr:hypothetical protein [Propionibacteriaceae bacterium]
MAAAGQRVVGGRLRRAAAALLAAVVGWAGPAPGAAADDMPPGLLISDQDGIRVETAGDYLIDARDLRPGEVRVTTLTIRNLERDIPFELFMTAEPVDSSGPVDPLDVVELDLFLEGRRLYHGRIRGDEDVNMIERALNLGVYAAGDSRVMTIRLTVAADLEIFPVKSRAQIIWHFYAVKDNSAVPPKTGQSFDHPFLKWSIPLLLGAALMLAANRLRPMVQPSAAASGDPAGDRLSERGERPW